MFDETKLKLQFWWVNICRSIISLQIALETEIDKEKFKCEQVR